MPDEVELIPAFPERRPNHKLTQEVHDRILEGVRMGMPKRYACQRAGVTSRVVLKWMTAAQNGDPGPDGLGESLLEQMKIAEGDFIASNLQVIDKAAKEKQWQAAAWLLERLHNEYFSANRSENSELRAQVALLLKQLRELGPAKD